MISIIAATNRKNNETLKIAKGYVELLKQEGASCQILDLSDLPKDFLFSALYGEKNEDFDRLVEQFIISVNKIVIVSPEYNGSFPGILKSFIEGWNPKQTPGKWAALVGVASGRQGNARGMDDLTNILNYLNMNVIPIKPPVSQVFNVLNKEGEIIDEGVIKLMKQQIELLLEK
ncbi:MAG: NAD(P)H-dependent oxidoreductase [Flavobacteriales bacterium]|nr:NAD(P)H-dependent oxidoreductase [Flavobacteriales bacterium]